MHFPGFDTHEFPNLSGTDLQRIDDTIRVVFRRQRFQTDRSAGSDRRAERSRDWWDTAPLLPNRMGAAFARPVEHLLGREAETYGAAVGEWQH